MQCDVEHFVTHACECLKRRAQEQGGAHVFTCFVQAYVTKKQVGKNK